MLLQGNPALRAQYGPARPPDPDPPAEELEWSCYAAVHGTKYLGTVTARTRAEALEKAEALDSCHVSICHHCSEQISDPEVGEITVEPTA